jgi:hypothetical protein
MLSHESGRIIPSFPIPNAVIKMSVGRGHYYSTEGYLVPYLHKMRRKRYRCSFNILRTGQLVVAIIPLEFQLSNSNNLSYWSICTGCTGKCSWVFSAFAQVRSVPTSSESGSGATKTH